MSDSSKPRKPMNQIPPQYCETHDKVHKCELMQTEPAVSPSSSGARKTAMEIASERDLKVITEPIDWEAIESGAEVSAEPEPLDSRMRCTECKEPVCDHLAAKLIPWLSSYIQPAALPESAAKVEDDYAVKFLSEYPPEKFSSSREMLRNFALWLRPYIPVSQPPVVVVKVLACTMAAKLEPIEWHELPELRREYYMRVATIVRDAILAAPVTPVSGNGPDDKYIEFKVAGITPKGEK